jgi:hypothetical protein
LATWIAGLWLKFITSHRSRRASAVPRGNWIAGGIKGCVEQSHAVTGSRAIGACVTTNPPCPAGIGWLAVSPCPAGIGWPAVGATVRVGAAVRPAHLLKTVIPRWTGTLGIGPAFQVFNLDRRSAANREYGAKHSYQARKTRPQRSFHDSLSAQN